VDVRQPSSSRYIEIATRTQARETGRPYYPARRSDHRRFPGGRYVPLAGAAPGAETRGEALASLPRRRCSPMWADKGWRRFPPDRRLKVYYGPPARTALTTAGGGLDQRPSLSDLLNLDKTWPPENPEQM